MFWCVSLRLCQPGLKKNEEQSWHLEMRPNIFFFFFLWFPSVQVKGASCIPHVKMLPTKSFTVSAEMESALMSLLGSKWVKCLLFSPFFSTFARCLVGFLGEPQFTSIPSQLLLCHTVLALGATPKPRTCSRYCRLFTWHRLNRACILTPALTACAGVGRGFFSVALFQLHLK